MLHLQEMDAYCAPHHTKLKSAGKPVYVLPLVLFSDVATRARDGTSLYHGILN